MSVKHVGGRIWIAAVLVGLAGLALLAVHGLALRAIISRATLPIGAAAVIVAAIVALHLGLLAPVTSRLRNHSRPKRH
jgi:hypothetical protein